MTAAIEAYRSIRANGLCDCDWTTGKRCAFHAKNEEQRRRVRAHERSLS